MELPSMTTYIELFVKAYMIYPDCKDDDLVEGIANKLDRFITATYKCFHESEKKNADRWVSCQLTQVIVDNSICYSSTLFIGLDDLNGNLFRLVERNGLPQKLLEAYNMDHNN